MKIKTYIGDLGQLKSCIKVSGSEVGMLKVIKKLTTACIPFKMDDNLNIYIQFRDYIKSGLSGIGQKEVKVVEHIEPLKVDIMLSRTGYCSYGDSFLLKCHGSYTTTTAYCERKDNIYWNLGIFGVIGKEDYKEKLKDFKGKYGSPNQLLQFKKYQTSVIAMLRRRDLIDEETYYGLLDCLCYTPKEMRYYEA